MQNLNLLTKNGHKELEDELKDRKTTVRRIIAEEIDKGREQGDLSENAAYKSALENKEFNETRISKIEEILKYSKIVKNENVNVISMGSVVSVYSAEQNRELKYEIVGETEADPAKNTISIESPIGSAMLGKKTGETFKVSTPGGEIEFEIKNVE